MDKVIDNKGWGRVLMSATKGAIVALCVAMVLILCFAFIVKWTSIDQNIINPVNQIIKIVSIFIGVLAACKSGDNCFKNGIMVGLLFSFLSFVLFSMLNSFIFSFDLTLVWDLLFGTVAGGLCGIVVRYLKK